MNKYQEALENIVWEIRMSRRNKKNIEYIKANFDLLKELVDKATPYKPDRDRGFPECSCGVGFHGKVENEVSDGLTINYCFSCGQKLDWR